MKQKLLMIITIAFFALAFQGFSQERVKMKTQLVEYGENVKAPLTADELSKLKEVYGDKLNKYVLSNPQRVKDFKHLLRNRLIIKKMPKLKDNSKYTNLSEVELFNNYNPDLKRDTSFNLSTFNPLKYNLEFFRMGSIIYKIDGTDYYISIKTQNLKK